TCRDYAAYDPATTITCLLKIWQKKYQTWRRRSPEGKEYVHLWADGIYFDIRLVDGYRESAESWASVLCDLKRRGLAAEQHWRRVNAPHLVALVKAGSSSRMVKPRCSNQNQQRSINACNPHRYLPPVRCRSTTFDNTSLLNASAL
ncbi:MAG: hypothetical protein U9R48_09585, partial [Chloroflexota bacterium]|nr:hypothetical protein [Chloroflexota bacterium]